jgi:hypothetical protein
MAPVRRSRRARRSFLTSVTLAAAALALAPAALASTFAKSGSTLVFTAAQTVHGGDGNDKITTSGGSSRIEGGPGNDVLLGGGPVLSGQRTYFVGGPGDDEITTGLDGDTVDCAGGGNDETNRFDSKVTFIGCGSAPTATVKVRRVRLRTFLKKGVQFTATCSQACGLSWQLMPAAKRDLSVIHRHGCRCFSYHPFSEIDENHGAFNRLKVTAGPQAFTATAPGAATQKAVGKRRSFKFKVALKVDNELTVERVVDTVFTLRR